MYLKINELQRTSTWDFVFFRNLLTIQQEKQKKTWPFKTVLSCLLVVKWFKVSMFYWGMAWTFWLQKKKKTGENKKLSSPEHIVTTKKIH